jgi:alkylation response protein AidB-like acyl-CoA dehydrogenase
MNFDFTPQQVQFRETISRYLKSNHSFEQRRRFVTDDASSLQLWKTLATIGVQGATFSESVGGSGGNAIESLVVMEEFGRALVAQPYVTTVVMAGSALRSASTPVSEDICRAIVYGDAIVAIAYAEPQSRYELFNIRTTARRQGSHWILRGHKALVLHAPQSTHMIVATRTEGQPTDLSGISLFAVASGSAGIRRQDYMTVDGFQAAEIYFNDVAVEDIAMIGFENGGGPLLERMVDEAIVATCAEACGVMREMLDRTIEYTRQRKQFGQALSSFQALQHRMVDMLIATEKAVSLTCMATIKSSDDAARSRAASAAKVQIAKSCRFVGQNAVQLHGGMGVVDEFAIGNYFKRATMLETAFGSLDHHLSRYAKLTGSEGA